MSRLDRRALFTSGAAAALLSAAGMSAQAQPRRGGTLRIAVQRRQAPCPIELGACYETLTDIGADGVLRPLLATRWDSADGRNWQITLRDDALFHDGTPVTAQAVVDSLAPRFLYLSARDDVTLDLLLPSVSPNLPWQLADLSLSVRGPADVGSGFYRLKDRSVGGHFLADRMTPHHRDGEGGWADRVQVVAIPNAAVRAEALRDGHVDVAELPAREGLRGRFQYHPSETDAALVARLEVAVPPRVSDHAPLDGGRLAERWGLV